MEFKGTEEVILSETKTGKLKITDKNGFSICTASNYDLETKANMQLYSKAPEMLEMLQEIVDYGGVANFDKLKQLIKDVTEL